MSCPVKIAFLSPWDPEDPSAWSGMVHRQFQALQDQPDTQMTTWFSGSVRPVLPDRLLERMLGRGRGGVYRAQLGVLTARRRAALVDRRVAQERPDAVLAVAASTDAALLTADVPVVHVTDATFDLVRDFYPDTTGLHWLTTLQARLVDRRLARTAAAHVVSNRWAAEGLLSAGVTADRVHVVPFGPRLEPRVFEAPAPRRNRRVLLVASNWERKAGDRVVRAVARARDRSDQAPELTVVGNSPVRLPEWVTHLGRVQPDRMAEIYASHDILVDLAAANAGGVTLTDAHAYGLPTVATDVGGVADIVQDQSTGYLVSDSDAEEQAASALLQLNDDDTWSRMSRAARTHHERTLNWSTWARRTRHIIGAAGLTESEAP